MLKLLTLNNILGGTLLCFAALIAVATAADEIKKRREKKEEN